MWLCKAGAQFIGEGWAGMMKGKENESREVFMTQSMQDL